MREIRPISEMGNRVQEAGKLKIGVRTGKAMKALDTWRFMTPHREQLDQLAAIYGGTVKALSDPKANPKDQFELISSSDVIHVLLPPGGLSQNYEHWVSSGCQRRCDGIHCTVPVKGPDRWQVVDCICMQENTLLCKLKTRLTVVFPDITFRGTWTLTTSSWNAADELVAMEGMIDQLQMTHDIINVDLTIEKRSRNTPDGMRHFVVPVLSIPGSPQELVSGSAGLVLGTGEHQGPGDAPALNPAASVDVSGTAPAGITAPTGDDEIAEAEILHDAHVVMADLGRIAHTAMVDLGQLEEGVVLGVTKGKEGTRLTDLNQDDLNAAGRFVDDVKAGRIEVRGVQPDGRLIIKRMT